MIETIFSAGYQAMLLRLLISTFFSWFIIDRLYYRKSHRRDFYFTFLMLSMAIFILVFFMIFVLDDMKGKVGIGVDIGLFGIFSIMRYRTDAMPVREMTYLFTLIALAVVNALGVAMPTTELITTNLIVTLAFALCERLLKVENVKLIQYDRIELIKPECRSQLIDDLEQRTGLHITKVDVGGIDFLRDMAILRVSYQADNRNSDPIDRIIKLKSSL